MKTSATNRKIHDLMTSLKNGTLVPNPDFQRRLVWANKHKVAFLETVLGGFPFPEIYIAAGELDTDTGESKILLVDGQQRITTLLQYFNGSEDIKLPSSMSPYAKMSRSEKEEFLEYEVVVRDLGKKTKEEIIEIFKKINSTNYALNSVEVHHAVYDGPFMKLAERLSEHNFFDEHRIFSNTEIKRYKDVGFILVMMISVMSVYFNREQEVESYLKRYNEEFELEHEIERDIKGIFSFVDRCNLGHKSRAWQKADLLTLLVELYKIIHKEKVDLNAEEVGERLRGFYANIDEMIKGKVNNINIRRYHEVTIQASNNRNSRIARGKILHKVLLGDELPEELSIA